MAQPKTDTSIGYYQIHPNVSINYQMNRFYDGSSEMLAAMKSVASSIKDYADYTRTFLRLSEEAFAHNNGLRGALYLRSAEFYMFPNDPLKSPSRKKFIETMREEYEIGPTAHHRINYAGGCLYAYRLTPQDAKGTIVLCGGFDSYAEELFAVQLFFYRQGYDIVVFEGPGQGSTLEESHIPMTPDWEEPVAAVLDYFQLADVTLIGYSMGGCLVVRAAAQLPRVRRVICDDIFLDFFAVAFHQLAPPTRLVLKLLVAAQAAPIVNAFVHRAMKRSLVVEWGVRHGMHITGTPSPMGFLAQTMRYETGSVSSKLTQDVLLLGAAEDHYVPLAQFYAQAGLMTNVRSLTARLFTRAEQAQNHVQIGNTGLALQVMTDWLEQLKLRDRLLQKNEKL